MSETHLDLEIKAWERMIEEIEEKKRHCLQKINDLKDELRFLHIIKENRHMREIFRNYISNLYEEEARTPVRDAD